MKFKFIHEPLIYGTHQNLLQTQGALPGSMTMPILSKIVLAEAQVLVGPGSTESRQMIHALANALETIRIVQDMQMQKDNTHFESFIAV